MVRKAVALFACVAENPGEISFPADAIIVDVSPSDIPQWFIGTVQETGETGLFPGNYVKFVEEKKFTIAPNSDDSQYPRPLEVPSAKPIISDTKSIDPLVRDKLKLKSSDLIQKARQRLAEDDDTQLVLINKREEIPSVKPQQPKPTPITQFPLRAAQPPSRPVKPPSLRPFDADPPKPLVEKGEFPGDKILRPSEIKARQSALMSQKSDTLSQDFQNLNIVPTHSLTASNNTHLDSKNSTFSSSTVSHIQPSLTIPTSRTRANSNVMISKDGGPPKSNFTSMSLDPLSVGDIPPPLPARKETSTPPMPPRPLIRENSGSLQSSGLKIPPRPKYDFIPNANRSRYEKLFLEMTMGLDATLSGVQVRQVWVKSKLTNEELSEIWKSVDSEGTGRLGCDQFCLGMFLIDEILREEAMKRGIIC